MSVDLDALIHTIYCNNLQHLQQYFKVADIQILKAEELVYQTSVIPVWSVDLLRNLVQLLP